MSDREQLAARLVEAAVNAGEIVDRDVAMATNSCCAMVIALAPSMIVAVLRELAAHPELFFDDLPYLADYIEKGAGER